MLDIYAAATSLTATPAHATFCGHTHVPALFHMTSNGDFAGITPVGGEAVVLDHQDQWLAVIGAVGQPRDHNPDACYAVLDDARATLSYVRVPYDVRTASRKIRAAGLPSMLATRLIAGM